MVAGTDSIDDMAILRHGGMGRLLKACYAPSTLGLFLRSFTFGHVRQLDAVASRFLKNLAAQTPLIGTRTGEYTLVDVDDTIIEIHGYQKQGSGYGYSGVRGLNALLATVSTKDTAPVIVAQRLRKGSAGSPRGAARMVADALATVKRLPGERATGPVLVREAAWKPIQYTDAVFDETADRWISSAEVAETGYTAFSSRKQGEHIPGRLVVRRIPDLNPHGAGQPTIFDTYRFHAFFTTGTPDTVAADKTHRGHAIIEQVNADLKDSALAHLPSGVFTANAAWLVLAAMAFNLTRAAATTAGNGLAKARTGTIRRKLISVPARIASSARKLRLHLPAHWPWETAWTALFTRVFPRPAKT